MRCLVLVTLLLAACSPTTQESAPGSLTDPTASPTGTAAPSGMPSSTASGAAGHPDKAVAIRYLALGDSFTIGTGSGPDLAFPARLSARWKTAGLDVTLLNPAVNGYTSQKIFDTETPQILPFGPTFVTLAAGANDIVQGRTADEYRTSLKALIGAVLGAGVPAAHLITLPQPDWSLSPVSASFGDPATLHAQIVAFNGILQNETVAAGGRYIDLFPLMEDEAKAALLAPDGLHPNAACHDAWAQALYDALPDLR
jgi:lysophospholipase L1-like esterase